jgi:hypothetical protein
MRAAAVLKLLLLFLVVVMIAKMGWGLSKGQKADPSPLHWVILAVALLQTAAWAIGRRRSNTP